MSLSKAIETSYYDALQEAQRSSEITEWINYFVRTILIAQTEAEELIEFSLQKTKFFNRFKDNLNDRQMKVIRRMLEEEGGMNASKYASITKASKATATRDLQELLQMQAISLLGDGGGRSTKYRINL